MPPLPPDTIPRKRFLGFLIWQSIPTTLLFLLSRAAIPALAPAPRPLPRGGAASSVLAFLLRFASFHLSQLLFSASLSFLSSPRPDRPASPLELALGLVRSAVESRPAPPELRRRARASLAIATFVVACAVSSFVGAAAVCWGVSSGDSIGRVVGFRGFVVGLLYGVLYVYKRRWVLKFSIVQRTLYFSFKMGLPSAARNAFKFSGAAYIFSSLLLAFLPDHCYVQTSMGRFLLEQIIFYMGTLAVFLCWELSHHLHQVLHTKRFIFAPPRGSAAAETNPSEPLLAALEESHPSSLVHYLAYLDLCMISENNVDTWRRAAFFEETGDTYKRVIAVCLRPLEKLAAKLAEGLETSADKSYPLSNQLLSPTDLHLDSSCYEPLHHYQLYAWCARAAASLTVHSHKEDRYGVAQLSGSNAAVLSTLLSCLLAVESFMGKRTHLQSQHQFMGAGGIKWATPNAGRKYFPSSTMSKKRGSPLHSKAYAIADVLRTSIYQIVSAFHDEMLAGAKSGILEKDWTINAKPPFGTRDLLLQKMHLFLDFRAS
ncbi:hypothetical protein EUGRSUZ_K02306 [Eucalyptus grandis]|uniref:Nucleoporin protein Ndc1-Nup n=2 Tax=Eucalyptus grandis TaxID=71139 RepID=A0A059A4I1_EUCGR|nr:hypothetical protein EUGRSUZ_K02306 [Eucalyptus grandis]